MIPRCSLSTLTSRQTSNRRSCWPYALSNAHRNKSKGTVEASTKVIEDAGSKVVGVFITGCDDTQPDPLKACFVDYPVPVWTLPAVDFNDDDAISKARRSVRDERRRRGTDRGTRIAIRRPDHTRMLSNTVCWARRRRTRRPSCCRRATRIASSKAADYLLERDIVDLIIVGERKRHSRPWPGIGIEIAWQGEIPSQG